MEDLRQKLKLFNYRPLVLVFLGIASGILFCNFIKSNTIATVIGSVIFVGVLLFYSILHKKIKYLVIIGITFVQKANIILIIVVLMDTLFVKKLLITTSEY